MIEIEKAKRILTDNGLKHTKKRKELLLILYRHDGYLTAKELQEKMGNVFPGISPDTIYRNLNTFSNLGIVETTELKGETLFQFSCSTEEHHHHFICSVCGKTIPLEVCPLDFLTDQLPGYEVQSHRFELFGKCDDCGKLDKY